MLTVECYKRAHLRTERSPNAMCGTYCRRIGKSVRILPLSLRNFSGPCMIKEVKEAMFSLLFQKVKLVLIRGS